MSEQKGQLSTCEQEEKPICAAGPVRARPAVAFGLGAALLAGVMIASGPVASPAGAASSWSAEVTGAVNTLVGMQTTCCGQR